MARNQSQCLVALQPQVPSQGECCHLYHMKRAVVLMQGGCRTATTQPRQNKGQHALQAATIDPDPRSDLMHQLAAAVAGLCQQPSAQHWCPRLR